MHLNDNLDLTRYDWAASVLQTRLADGPSKVVWDIGAGDGRMRSAVEAAGGNYHGFDLYPSLPQINRWDLDEPPDPGGTPAGAALLLEVIEHCNNPGRALRHIADALVPQGLLIMTMPNPRWSRSRLFALAAGHPICFTQSDLDVNHHVFTPWPHIVERLLTDAGFRVEYYATIEGKSVWPGSPYDLRYPVRLLVAAGVKAIERRDPSACGMSYGLIARKTGEAR